jgi:hypothetical protein
VLSSILFLSACATYTDKIREIRNELVSGNEALALALLEKSDLAGQKRNTVLFHMERGMLKYISGQYEQATQDWTYAIQRSEDLYTTSLSKVAASLTISEDMTDYEGEDHEKIFLPIFSSLAFFSRGDLNKALVEIRKTYEMIGQLKLDREEAKNILDGFPHFISALLFEASLNWDNAIIEYRKALVKYSNQGGNQAEAIKAMIADSLWKIAEFRRRTEVVSQLQQAGYKRPAASLQETLKDGEVLVLVEEGQSPVKVAQDFSVNLGSSVVNVSYPQYQHISSPSSSTRILCNGKACGASVMSSDIGELSHNALERRRLKDFAKMTARLFIKEQARQAARKHLGELGNLAVMAANFATERADTRSWTLLPANLQFARVQVPSDTDVDLKILADNALGPTQWRLRIPPGRKKLLRVRTF